MKTDSKLNYCLLIRIKGYEIINVLKDYLFILKTGYRL
jgi:hypothetical protein